MRRVTSISRCCCATANPRSIASSRSRPICSRSFRRDESISLHRITESGHPPPSDYFDSFLEIGALGIVDRQFARRVAACAGLRNRITHEYDEIDPERVHAAIPPGFDGAAARKPRTVARLG